MPIFLFLAVTGLEMGKDIVNVSVNFSSVSLLNVIGELKQQFSYNRTQVVLTYIKNSGWGGSRGQERERAVISRT